MTAGWRGRLHDFLFGPIMDLTGHRPPDAGGAHRAIGLIPTLWMSLELSDENFYHDLVR